MKEELKRALVEVDAVLENSSKDINDKIPKRFKDYIKNNKSQDYTFEIDKTKDILDQNLSKEARQIIALMYRDYIVDKDKRQELLEQEKEKQIKKEEELKEKYNPDNIFKKIEDDIPVKEDSIINNKNIDGENDSYINNVESNNIDTEKTDESIDNTNENTSLVNKEKVSFWTKIKSFLKKFKIF